MLYVLRTICFISLISCLLSCGHEKVEDDKYPEMPVFPKTSNTAIKIVKIYDNYNDIYKFDNQFFSFRAINWNQYIFYYNNDLTIRDSIRLNKLNYVKENGFIYSKAYKEDKAFKLDIKTGKTYPIAFHKYNAEKAYDKYFKAISEAAVSEEKHLSDSLKRIANINRRRKVDKRIAEEFKKAVTPGLKYVKPLADDYYLLQYEDRDMIIDHVLVGYDETGVSIGPSAILKEFEDNFKELEFYTFETLPIIKVFDTAVRGNRLGSSGKFDMNIVQSGFEYTELKYNGVTARFKLNSKYLGTISSLKPFYTPDKKIIIIYNEDDQEYYRIEEN